MRTSKRTSRDGASDVENIILLGLRAIEQNKANGRSATDERWGRLGFHNRVCIVPMRSDGANVLGDICNSLALVLCICRDIADYLPPERENPKAWIEDALRALVEVWHLTFIIGSVLVEEPRNPQALQHTLRVHIEALGRFLCNCTLKRRCRAGIKLEPLLKPLDEAQARLESVERGLSPHPISAGAGRNLVVLTGEESPVQVRGRDKGKLTRKRYKLIQALQRAGHEGLTKARIEAIAPGARKMLTSLRGGDPDWKAVIQMADTSYGVTAWADYPLCAPKCARHRKHPPVYPPIVRARRAVWRVVLPVIRPRPATASEWRFT
jgi:hypothetical protein